MRQIRVGSIGGIPILLDITFLLVVPVFAVAIALQVDVWAELLNAFADIDIDGSRLDTGPLPWILGLGTALALFGGVLAHELGHSAMAMRYGVATDSITLWLFGGVARLEQMPADWRQELDIAVAGPAVSIVCGFLATVVFLAVGSGGTTGADIALFVLGYLAVMNVGLAAFNMLPGFPMDGGRVLRAVLSRSRPHAEATRQAAVVGKGVSLFLAVVGLLLFNLLLVGLAIFLYIAASNETQRALDRLNPTVLVRDVMIPAEYVEPIDERTSVECFLELLFEERRTWYPVACDGHVVGFVTLEDARTIRRADRDAVSVGTILRTCPTATPTDALSTYATSFKRHDIDRIPVVEAGQLVGSLPRDRLGEYVRSG